jgi:hypothetical protein
MKKTIHSLIVCVVLVVFTSGCSKQNNTVVGCTDPTAFNYNANANQNSGCIAKVYGCTDRSASNYSTTANVSNGTCTYDGTVQFWVSSAGYLTSVNVQVNIDGQTGHVTDWYPSPLTPQSTYTCQGCATLYMPEGTYSYTASGMGKNWYGNVTVTHTATTQIQIPD